MNDPREKTSFRAPKTQHTKRERFDMTRNRRIFAKGSKTQLFLRVLPCHFDSFRGKVFLPNSCLFSKLSPAVWSLFSLQKEAQTFEWASRGKREHFRAPKTQHTKRERFEKVSKSRFVWEVGWRVEVGWKTRKTKKQQATTKSRTRHCRIFAKGSKKQTFPKGTPLPFWEFSWESFSSEFVLVFKAFPHGLELF